MLILEIEVVRRRFRLGQNSGGNRHHGDRGRRCLCRAQSGQPLGDRIRGRSRFGQAGGRSRDRRLGRGRGKHGRGNGIGLGEGSGGGFGARFGGGQRGLRQDFVACPQMHAVFLNLGFDPAMDLALGDAVQHRGIGCGRFGPEIAVFGGQIAEILRNRPHGVEWIVKPFQRAGKGSVGYCKDLTRTDHRMLAFYELDRPTMQTVRFNSVDRTG